MSKPTEFLPALLSFSVRFAWQIVASPAAASAVQRRLSDRDRGWRAHFLPIDRVRHRLPGPAETDRETAEPSEGSRRSDFRSNPPAAAAPQTQRGEEK